jgi:predicted enzyme related to lactoylglutathione lyase
MSMFIKLTNAASGHKGNPIYINVDQIAAVFEVASEEGGSLSTRVFGGPTGQEWRVEESLGEVMTKIESQVDNTDHRR